MNSKKKQVASSDKSKQATISLENEATSFNKIWLILLLVITAFVYMQARNNALTNWDDKTYLTDSPHVRTMHGDSVGYTISYHFKNFIFANYHPLTTLTYSALYNKYELDPAPYHTLNVFIHMINIFLVFLLIWKFTQQQWTALITATIFALHPLHVESVAWVSELKDVLFTGFYLASILCYYNYLQSDKKKVLFYLLTFVFFLLSLFSKGMAVSLPIVLLAVDYLVKRTWSWKLIIEKLPFLALSIVFGLLAIAAQKSASAVGDNQPITFIERLLFSCYALCLYLWKFIVPMDLSCFYAYPQKGTSGTFPLMVYISPLFLAVIAWLTWKFARLNRTVIFGWMLFLISIALVLQLLPVGDAIIAERYTYIPYIGLAFIVGSFAQRLMNNELPKLQSLKTPLLLGLGVLLLIFTVQSFQRIKVWKDSHTLWSDAIEKDPTVSRQYRSRGDAYEMELKQHQDAITDYSKAIELNPNYDDAYYNRGISYYYNQEFDKALADYNKAFKLKPDASGRHFNRAITYHSLNKFELALADYTTAINNKELSPNIYYNRGLSYQSLSRFKEAVADYKIAAEKNPTDHLIYNSMGLCYYFQKQYKEALEAYTQSVNLNPNFAEVYNNRAGIYYMNKDYASALSDALNAQKLGYPMNAAFIAELQQKSK